MDYIDKQILLSLFNNCRITYQELATSHNLSSNAIKKRIDKLESTGVIEKYVVELSLAMVDAETAMLFISTNGSETSKDFITELGKNETINYVGELSGSVYLVFISYQNGSVGLGQVTAYLRSFEFVTKIEIYPTLMMRGKKEELSRQELLVLRELMKNPREPVSSIASSTNLPSRVIKKILDDFKTNNRVLLTIRWNVNAGNNIIFLERIEYDEKTLTLDKLNTWLDQTFPKSYLIPLICSTVPVIYGAFTIDQLNEIEDIDPVIKKFHGIKSVITYMGKPSYSFDDIKVQILKKLLVEKLPSRV